MPNVISCIFGWNALDRATLGLLGAGQRLAKELGAQHAVLVLGTSLEASAQAEIAALADSVHLANHELLAKYHSENTLSALTQACKTLEPQAVLLGNDTYGQELTPRLAHRLGGSASGDALRLEAKDGAVVITRPVYGGKAQAVVALRRAPAVVWVRARAQAAPEPQPQSVSIQTLELSLHPDNRVR